MNSSRPFSISRRSFLRMCGASAAAAGVPAWFIERELSAATPGSGPPAPNDRPGVALVGCGGMGRGDAANAARFGDIVAVCDVDQNHAQQAAKQAAKTGRTPEVFSDFRKVMERKDVQIILCATPDHWHTLVNLAATQAGKDVYGEKPLTLTIDEGKRLVAAVRKHKTVFQTGSQQRSDPKFRLACELVRSGRLGKLKEITVWLPAGLRDGPFKPAAVPAGLNWDFWLGQAPQVDYVPQRCHVNFRFWYDYSGGTLTDWGAHHNDIARWAIGFEGPSEVSAKALEAPIPGGFTAISDYEVQLTWPNGVIQNIRTTKAESIGGAVQDPDGQRNGVRFEGSDGWIWVSRSALKASEEALISTPLPDSAQRLYQSNDHMANFFDCVRGRKAPVCEAEIGHRSATICHLAVIALRLGQKLTWDPKNERFTGDHAAEANAWVTREMRKPYDYGFI